MYDQPAVHQQRPAVKEAAGAAGADYLEGYDDPGAHRLCCWDLMGYRLGCMITIFKPLGKHALGNCLTILS